MRKPSGFSAFEQQLPIARTSYGWLIEQINFDARANLIELRLIEILPKSSNLSRMKANLKVDRPLSFRVADEGELCHYWNARSNEGVDPRISIYVIEHSAYLDEVSANTLVGHGSKLRHVLIGGEDACLECIVDEYTKFEIFELH